MVAPLSAVRLHQSLRCLRATRVRLLTTAHVEVLAGDMVLSVLILL